MPFKKIQTFHFDYMYIMYISLEIIAEEAITMSNMLYFGSLTGHDF